MCCQSMRILLLFLLTALSFVANHFLRAIPTIVWYFILVNSFTCILFFVNFLLLKTSQKPLKDKMLYYFSGIGGIYGGFLMMIFWSFYELSKKFVLFQTLILGLWSLGLILLFNFYPPFTAIIKNLFMF